jgi:hypothetical protein
MGKRIAFALLGSAAGVLIVLAISAIRKPHHWEFMASPAMALCIACGVVATLIAERMGKVKSIEELQRPLTLFPRSSPPESR